MPSVSATEVVVLPSPALVGVMPATQTSFAFGLSESRSMASSEILAL